jgi:hypothetical protein
MKNLFFWAQSLDNQSPDTIIEDGNELFDDTQRQQVVLDIYQVPGKKREFFEKDSKVSIRFSDPKFVIEAIPAEKDQADRLAPIVIYGELPKKDASQWWIDDVCKEIDHVVADKLNRTISRDSISSIRKMLTTVLEEKKKRSEIKIIITSLAIIFLVALALIVYWLVR